MPGSLVTIDEFLKLPSSDCLRELVRGRVIESKLRTPRHGAICSEIVARLWTHSKTNGGGRVIGNNSAVITHREPDSMRGPDVAYYSSERLPHGPLPSGCLKTMPDVVFDVLDESDHWSDVIEKALEYLHSGVRVACIVDPQKRSMAVFRDGAVPKLFHAEAQFCLPEVLPDFCLSVGELFE